MSEETTPRPSRYLYSILKTIAVSAVIVAVAVAAQLLAPHVSLKPGPVAKPHVGVEAISAMRETAKEQRELIVDEIEHITERQTERVLAAIRKQAALHPVPPPDQPVPPSVDAAPPVPAPITAPPPPKPKPSRPKAAAPAPAFKTSPPLPEPPAPAPAVAEPQPRAKRVEPPFDWRGAALNRDS